MLQEAEIGQALQDVFNSGQLKREDIFIQSKLWNSNHRPEHVKKDLEATLRDLQVDYVDSFVIHWPQARSHCLQATTACKQRLQQVLFTYLLNLRHALPLAPSLGSSMAATTQPTKTKVECHSQATNPKSQPLLTPALLPQAPCSRLKTTASTRVITVPTTLRPGRPWKTW